MKSKTAAFCKVIVDVTIKAATRTVAHANNLLIAFKFSNIQTDSSNNQANSSRLFLSTSSSSFISLCLRRSVRPQVFIAALSVVCASLTSCVKNMDITLKGNQPLLVVEAYINNEMRDYNYVVLTKSVSYASSDFESVPVTNATVSITEGEKLGNNYSWNSSSKVQLQAANVPGVPAALTSIYFDPRLVTDSSNALRGIPGKSYLLEINEGGHNYSAVTTLLPPVQIDSLTTGFSYIDQEDGNKSKVRITNNYQDPDTLNNTELYLYRFSENRNRFGWGGFFKAKYVGTDDVTNGQYMRITGPRGFSVGDTVTYHMASVTRDVYNFWQSFNSAENNEGPFATPVTLVSNIRGENVTGCFSGMSLSSKTIITK